MIAYICGGTHGNEIPSLEAVKKWATSPAYTPKNFHVETLIVNEPAVTKHKRYLDCDIQDYFDFQSQQGASPYGGPNRDYRKALDVGRRLGGKKDDTPAVNLIIDCHTTDSNMGITINVSRWSTCLQHTIYLVLQEHPEYKCLWTPCDRLEGSCLDTMGKDGITLECGAVEHNTPSMRWESKITEALACILRAYDAHLTEEHSAGEENETEDEEESEVPPFIMYKDMGSVQYPSDEYECVLKGKDWKLLHKGDVIFTGPRTLVWKGDDCYPTFVDETAYKTAEEGYVAFDLCRKIDNFSADEEKVENEKYNDYEDDL